MKQLKLALDQKLRRSHCIIFTGYVFHAKGLTG